MGANRFIWNHSIQSDGKIIIAGTFNSYNGTERNQIALLFPITTSSIDHPLAEKSQSVKILPNPFRNTATLQSEIEMKNATLTIFNFIGPSVKQISPINIGPGNNLTLNRDHFPGGLYFIQKTQENQVIVNDRVVISD